MIEKLGIVKDSDKDIATVYYCPKCGEMLQCVESKHLPDTTMYGWRHTNRSTHRFECLKCKEVLE